ncbi:Uu.00g132320.m01.CDS01 [Anthostomella pinea]|uniref:Uu.00g132320.m01.CDS01 n=1 Tax=Anthostomella pinea TaxID=933095 RepID=A0AAI8VJ32_9PEZI|nr:Uu.00g132320.m01.CDS01 [Anthostomella pinea]
MRSSTVLSALRFPGHGQGLGRCSMAAQDTKASHDAVLRGKIYIDALPADVAPIRRLLEKYSGIRAKDVDEHIHYMRDRLWEIYPYVCIGHFRFLSLQFTYDPRYQMALRRLLLPRSRATFLDLACCVGQVLRQLAYDGVDANRLYGTDLEPRFLDAGYDLFKDRAKFKATFVAGDMVKPGEGDARLQVLDGKMSIIHATSFFHLFTWDDQVQAATRMIRFLDPHDPDATIFGRHVGTTKPGDRQGPRDNARYLHNAETWQKLWDEVGKLTGTAWRTEFEPIEKVGGHSTSSLDDTLRRMSFGVYRA